MKFNFGSNTVRKPDTLNVDIRDIPGVDIVDDVSVLSKIEDESAEYIYAHNILEHFAYDQTHYIVQLWVRKLMHGGEIEISVPDGELIFERYQKGIVTREQYIGLPWLDLVHSIFGNMKLEREWHGEDAERYMHHTLFSKDHLLTVMVCAGLNEIRQIEPHHSDNMAFVGRKN